MCAFTMWRHPWCCDMGMSYRSQHRLDNTRICGVLPEHAGHPSSIIYGLESSAGSLAALEQIVGDGVRILLHLIGCQQTSTSLMQPPPITFLRCCEWLVQRFLYLTTREFRVAQNRNGIADERILLLQYQMHDYNDRYFFLTPSLSCSFQRPSTLS